MAAVHRFIIDDWHPDGLAYECRVYPTRRLYLAAVNRRERGFTGERDNYSQATTFHDTTTYLLHGREFKGPLRGSIYMHEEMFDANIVTHEATHAALNLFRQRNRGVAALGRNDGTPSSEREEAVALSAGRLAQAIADKAWDLKVWTRKR